MRQRTVLVRLSSVDLNLSVEVFPPKSGQEFISVIGDNLVACGSALPGLLASCRWHRACSLRLRGFWFT